MKLAMAAFSRQRGCGAVEPGTRLLRGSRHVSAPGAARVVLDATLHRGLWLGAWDLERRRCEGSLLNPEAQGGTGGACWASSRDPRPQ